MYINKAFKDHVISEIVTEREYIFAKASVDRLIEIINNPAVRVLETPKVSNNSFGDWYFIKLGYKDICLSGYGIGYNYRTEQYDAKTFRLDLDERAGYHISEMSKDRVIKEIKDREAEIRGYGNEPITDRGIIYNMLAELGDEDAAAVAFDDREF